jgi:FtsZ-binding cell division protein ZapB
MKTRLFDRLAASVKALVDPFVEDTLQTKIDELDRLALQAAEDVKTSRQQKDEFYCLVERMQAQRDEWRETYKTAVSAYHLSLSGMEQELSNARYNLTRLAAAYNALREKNGEAKLTSWDGVPAPHDPPVGIAREYLAEMGQLLQRGIPYCREERQRAGGDADRPADTDGLRERAKVIAVREVRCFGDRPS